MGAFVLLNCFVIIVDLAGILLAAVCLWLSVKTGTKAVNLPGGHKHPEYAVIFITISGAAILCVLLSSCWFVWSASLEDDDVYLPAVQTTLWILSLFFALGFGMATIFWVDATGPGDPGMLRWLMYDYYGGKRAK